MGQGGTHQILLQMTHLTLVERSGMGQGGTHQILLQMTHLTLWSGRVWVNEEPIKFCCR